jgi:transcriptional regulator with XRE-family HTH domain
MRDQTTGIPTLDTMLGGGLTVGDNTVLVGAPAQTRAFVRAFLDTADLRARFVSLGADVMAPMPSVEVIQLAETHIDLEAVEASILDGLDAPGARLVVDGLDEIALRWGVPTTVSFYRRVCPQLYDAGTIAYWTGSRRVLPTTVIEQLTQVAQISFELTDGRLRVAKAEGHAPRLRGSIVELAGTLDRPVLSREHTVGRIGEGIRRVRHQRNLTQNQISRLAGVTPAAISQAETGRRGLSLDTLVPLCDALGIGIDDLLGASATDDYQIARRGRGPAPDSSLGAELPGLRIHLIHLPPGGAGRPPFRHKGREVVLAIDGLVMVELDDAMPVLRHGDSLTVTRSVMRSWTNLGANDASFFWLALE